MLNVAVLCIGKLKERYLAEACAEYQKRLAAFCKLEIIELPECKLPDNPSEKQIAAGLLKEGELILGKIPREAFAIPLCIEGKMLASPQLADKLREIPLSGRSQLAFIIGGSFGLSEAVKARGDLKLSMSPMTFPHQLARVMLLEQVYRGFSIVSHAKYHK